MESKSTFMILIMVIAVLALSLAALAGYLFIVQGASDGKDGSQNVMVDKDIPKKEDRITIPLFEGKRVYNLKSTNEDKTPMIQVAVSLDCYKELKNNKKSVVEEKIESYMQEVQELVVRFFLTKTSDDVRNIAVMDKAKQELADQINNLLNECSEKPEDIVYKVIFSEWLFQ